jgi:hypothetical protein
MNWYPDACPVCHGDLHDDFDDKGWVTCFSCARSFGPDDERLAEAVRSRNTAKDLSVAVSTTRAA